MGLFTEMLIKAVLTLAAMAGCFFLLRRKLSAGAVGAVCAAVFCLSVVSALISGLIPPLEETVSLTAAVEEGDEAPDSGIAFTGFKVDGREFHSGKDFEPVQGSWDLRNDAYCWDGHGDTNETIVFKVPVGRERQLWFKGNEGSGKVRITAGGKTWTIDTNNRADIAEPIGESALQLILLSRAREIAAYTAMFAILLGLLYLGVVLAKRHGKRGKRSSSEKRGVGPSMSRGGWRNVFSAIEPSGAIAILAAGVIAFVICSNFYGTKAVITPNGPGVVFRGAYVDDEFYYGADIYSGGNWKSSQNLCTSVDASPLTVRLPIGTTSIGFNAGPEQGTVKVSMRGETFELDLRDEENIEYGKFFSVDTGSLGAVIPYLSALAVIVILTLLKILYPHFQKYLKWKYLEPVIFLSLLVTVAAVTYYVCRSSTPRIPSKYHFYGYDAAEYRLQGKGWLRGYIPYRDIFEIKGPLFIFINMAAEWISSQYGLYLLQVLALWISMIFAYYTAKEIGGPVVGIISAFATVFLYLLVTDEGALVEDFNLPFLMLSTWLVVKYINSCETGIEHPPKYAFVHGVTCAASLAMRVTNCLSICCFVFCISVYLLIKKRYKNLALNGTAFIGGALVVIAPFVLYFAMNNAVHALIESYLYQFQYAVYEMPEKSGEQLAWMAAALSPVLACALLSLERNRLYKACMIFSAVMNVYMMMKLAVWQHYYIVFLTYVPIAMGWFLAPGRKENAIPGRYVAIYAAVTLILVSGLTTRIVTNAQTNCKFTRSASRGEEWTYEYCEKAVALGSNIPDEDRDRVFSYNTRVDWYLANDLFPCNRFCGKMDQWSVEKWPQMREELMEVYESLEAKWIVVSGEILDEDFGEIISNHYELVDEETAEQSQINMRLYKLIDEGV